MDTSKQKKLLDLIASDARFREEELAAMLGESVEEIRNTLKELEEKHIICGYHTLIDWDKVTTERVNALIEVRVTPQRGKGFDGGGKTDQEICLQEGLGISHCGATRWGDFASAEATRGENSHCGATRAFRCPGPSEQMCVWEVPLPWVFGG